jgi:serine/threonine-protein kinase
MEGQQLLSLQLPGYELVTELGQGALGSVHLARHVASGREVAIKRIVGGATSQDPETVLRFEREARLLARLDHPHLVHIHELLMVGGDLFVVMEYVPGTDLGRLTAETPPDADTAASYVADVAAALDHAHQQGVVHRDLKPANVLIGADGVLKVADLGLARLLERQARFTTARGTAAYMAPELARGDATIDRRADVYSLGVIAYELLVGRVPFPFDPADPYATVRAHVEQPPPDPHTLVPGFPPLLEAALLWALHKQPERRPATAGEFAAAVQDALKRSPAVAVPAPRQAPAEEEGTARPARPTPRWLPIAAAALVAAVGLVGLGAWAAAKLMPAAPPPEGLRIDAVAIATDPADGTGHCPHAVTTVRATITTNGGPGRIDYEWLRPDGTVTPGASTAPRPGSRRLTVTTSVVSDGTTPAAGVVALHVVGPADVYSRPARITYSCP